MCEHGRERHRCKECGGKGICEHGHRRNTCKECGGKGICEHGRHRYFCKECGGKGICEHGRQRSRCKECGGKGICEHGHRRSRCKECGGKGLCEHGRKRNVCKECGRANERTNGDDNARSTEGRPLKEVKEGDINAATATSALATLAAAAVHDDGAGASLAPTGQANDDSQSPEPDDNDEGGVYWVEYDRAKRPWPGVVFGSWESMREAGVPIPGSWKKLRVRQGHVAVLYCGTQNTWGVAPRSKLTPFAEAEAEAEAPSEAPSENTSKAGGDDAEMEAAVAEARGLLAEEEAEEGGAGPGGSSRVT